MTYYDVNSCRLFWYKAKVYILSPYYDYENRDRYSLIHLRDWSTGVGALKSECREILEPELTRQREAILYFYNINPPKT